MGLYSTFQWTNYLLIIFSFHFLERKKIGMDWEFLNVGYTTNSS
jgi:hypothetical protein